MLEAHDGTRSGKHPRAGLGPFDEDNRVLEIRLEVPPLRGRDAAKAEQVEVRYIDAAPIAMADGEGRARDRAGDTERTRRPANERRLARPKLPGDGDDVARLEVADELCCERFGLRGRVCLCQNNPSWTAGSAVTRARKTGSGGGATSRPRSSGSRAKSDFNTSSMRGV
jgi:hypothetical protein